METETQTRQKLFVAGIFTPYLNDNMLENIEPEELAKQIIKFGYDPNNFSGMQGLSTDNYAVLFERCNGGGYRLATDCRSDIAVVGSTEPAEDEVLTTKGTGLIVARYSIFYGGPSGYTRRGPEEGGYAIDIPKHVVAVKALLTDEDCLDAIVSRDEGRINDALRRVSSSFPEPIVATPYLAEALNIPRERRYR